jgi:myo-inositol 2-dehydrogenase / D-chiro-inositol 1-dehydrogenase
MQAISGIGFIGGGLATQAIHLPTLAKLGDDFRVRRIVDVDFATAANVAARCGAEASTSVNDIYDDPEIDVVAICSPHAFHAEQTIAACRSGKRLVLCEKPLAETRAEAQEMIRVAKEAGTHLVVGAMHVYDPAYRAAYGVWAQSGDEARHVHSTIFLPSNDRFIDQATDRAPQPPALARPRPDLRDPKIRAAMIRAAILGLATHNLPLVRQFVPSIDSVESASFVPGFGYELSFVGCARAVRMLALMPGQWEPRWSLRVIGESNELSAIFPPSYVLAGSSASECRGQAAASAFQFGESGYEALWSHVHGLMANVSQPLASLDEVIADFDYAMELADRVDAFLGVRP